MKKIINNKLYDTETAKELGTYSNSGGWRDFRHFEEVLYRKKTGEYFLHGEGGPLTQYAEPAGTSGWQSGARIMPLSLEEARQWAEEHLEADEYEAIFGEVTEDGSKVVVGYSISSAAAELARRRAAEAGVSISAYIEGLILGDKAGSK